MQPTSGRERKHSSGNPSAAPQLRILTPDEFVMGRLGVDVTGTILGVIARLYEEAHPSTQAAVLGKLAGSEARFIIDRLDMYGGLKPSVVRRQLVNYCGDTF